MIEGIAHIGIAVKSLDEALKAYEGALGLKVHGIHKAPQQGMNAAMVEIGEAHLELIEPVGTEGTIAKFIESKGEGIHHICVETENIEKTLADLAAKGVRLIDQKPRQGIEGKVAFIHPKSMNGVLIELVEKAK